MRDRWGLIRRIHLIETQALPEAFCRWGFLLAHVRIIDIAQRNESFLDGLHGGPSGDVLRTSGLVVGAAHPGAAEWLLSHNASSRFVVDVEIAGRDFELLESVLQELLVLREYCSGESERSGTFN